MSVVRIVSERLMDRLDDCKDRRFESVAVLSGASSYILPKLLRRKGVERVVVMDSSREQLERLKTRAASLQGRETKSPSVEFLMMDGEVLPVEPGSFDCEWRVMYNTVCEQCTTEHLCLSVVISCLGLHWFNELPVSDPMIKRIIMPRLIRYPNSESPWDHQK